MADTNLILCPTDFSEGSLAALDEAAGLAKSLGASVCVLHVCPLLLYAIAPGAVPDAPTFEADIKAKLRDKLEQVGRRLAGRGIPVETLLRDGNPGHVIAEVASERGAKLIALATHGRTGLSRLALGSIAERVVRTATVPVLTLHGPA